MPRQPTKQELRLINTHAEIVGTDWLDNPKQFHHSLLAQLSLPHRSQGDATTYEKVNGRLSLQIESGKLPTANGWTSVGLPYGPKARLLLIHVIDLAVKNQSRSIPVATTFTGFCREIGLSTDSRSRRLMRDQVNRMATCLLRVKKENKTSFSVFQGHLFSKFEVGMPSNENQLQLWTDSIVLSEEFFNSLQVHSLPLDRRAIAALKHSSIALDCYSWLVSRLTRIRTPVHLKWNTLRYQFSSPSSNYDTFRRTFEKALRQTLVVYPTANVDIIKSGIILRRSLPPIAPSQKSVGYLFR